MPKTPSGGYAGEPRPRSVEREAEGPMTASEPRVMAPQDPRDTEYEDALTGDEYKPAPPTSLRDALYAAELDSRPHAESPDDLLEDWLIPVFMRWHEQQRRLAVERIEALRENLQDATDRAIYRDNVLLEALAAVQEASDAE